MRYKIIDLFDRYPILEFTAMVLAMSLITLLGVALLSLFIGGAR